MARALHLAQSWHHSCCATGMRTSYLFASLLGVAFSVACNHEHEPMSPASATAEPAAVGMKASGDGVVKGNAPSSDPATDQSILARTSGMTGGGGAPGKAPGTGGMAGFGMGGLAGGTPVSRP